MNIDWNYMRMVIKNPSFLTELTNIKVTDNDIPIMWKNSMLETINNREFEISYIKNISIASLILYQYLLSHYHHVVA